MGWKINTAIIGAGLFTLFNMGSSDETPEEAALKQQQQREAAQKFTERTIDTLGGVAGGVVDGTEEQIDKAMGDKTLEDVTRKTFDVFDQIRNGAGRIADTAQDEMAKRYGWGVEPLDDCVFNVECDVSDDPNPDAPNP